MKLRIWSDVHTEFGPLTVTKTDTDADTVLVIAGDFMVWASPDRNQLLDDVLAGLCKQFKAVVYICGNHEFYGSDYHEVINGFRTFADSHSNFHFLDGDYAIIDDVRFVGGTLWTDLDDGSLDVRQLAQYSMNDYRHIRYHDGGEEKRIDSLFVMARNAEYRKAFKDILSVPFAGKNLVVSHHLPCQKQALAYTDGGLEYAYGNTRMGDILTLPIDLWIHGHVHIRQVYELNGITVVANPRGYHGHQAMAYTFDDARIWEV